MRAPVSLHRGSGPVNYRPMTKPTTLFELKQTEWASPTRVHRTVKDELRANLVCLLDNGAPLIPRLAGHAPTAIPQLANPPFPPPTLPSYGPPARPPRP